MTDYISIFTITSGKFVVRYRLTYLTDSVSFFVMVRIPKTV